MMRDKRSTITPMNIPDTPPNLQDSLTGSTNEQLGPSGAETDGKTAELTAFNAIVTALRLLPADAQDRVIKSALTILGITVETPSRATTSRGSSELSTIPKPGSFSEDRTLTAKQFMFEKRPVTDIERVACLAYYLTHYRSTPHFRRWI